MDLNQFNNVPRGDVIALMRPCADIERWAAEIADARPYGSVEEVLEAARTAADPWTEAELDTALTHHPPIGGRTDTSGGDGSGRGTGNGGTGDDLTPEAKLSRAEQASLGETSADLEARLAAGNAAYEDKFGHVFLIRAAGRTREEILASLQERMNNNRRTERQVVAEQLRQIAVLRLEGIIQ